MTKLVVNLTSERGLEDTQAEWEQGLVPARPPSQCTGGQESSSTTRGRGGGWEVNRHPSGGGGAGWRAGAAEEAGLRDPSGQLRGPGPCQKPALLPADGKGVWGSGQHSLCSGMAVPSQNYLPARKSEPESSALTQEDQNPEHKRHSAAQLRRALGSRLLCWLRLCHPWAGQSSGQGQH